MTCFESPIFIRIGDGEPLEPIMADINGQYFMEIVKQEVGIVVTVSTEDISGNMYEVSKVVVSPNPAHIKKKSTKTVKIDAKSESEVNDPVVLDQEYMVMIEEEEVPLGLVKFSDAYVTGYPDGTFRPDDYVSRGEVATIFVRILRLDTHVSKKAPPKYTDLDENKWFYDYVEALADVDIMKGYDDNTFKAENTVSHAEIAAMISRYWDYIGTEVSDSDAGVKDISDSWAAKYVNKMYNTDLLNVKETPYFKPNEPTKRAELVVWINQLVGRAARCKKNPTYKDVDPDEKNASDIESASYEWK